MISSRGVHDSCPCDQISQCDPFALLPEVATPVRPDHRDTIKSSQSLRRYQSLFVISHYPPWLYLAVSVKRNEPPAIVCEHQRRVTSPILMAQDSPEQWPDGRPRVVVTCWDSLVKTVMSYKSVILGKGKLGFRFLRSKIVYSSMLVGKLGAGKE